MKCNDHFSIMQHLYPLITSNMVPSVVNNISMSAFIFFNKMLHFDRFIHIKKKIGKHHLNSLDL